MNGPEALLAAYHDAVRQFHGVVDGLTSEQCAYEPGGTANPIGPTYHHIVIVLDTIMNKTYLDRTPLYERDGWAYKLGLPAGMRLDPAAPGIELFDPESFKPYADAVIAEGEAYLRSLTDADLDREVTMFRGPVPLGSTVAHVLVNHMVLHTGEIAVVKGLQGLKGL